MTMEHPRELSCPVSIIKYVEPLITELARWFTKYMIN